MFTAVLDSCVLWPSLLRDFLLSLAIEGSYRALWSSAILSEVERNEARKLIDRGADRREAVDLAKRLVAHMRAGFANSEAEGWQQLEGRFGLPDPDDEHVLAAAVVGGAGMIVTENRRDFPPTLIPRSIDVVTPAAFVFEVVHKDPDAAGEAIRQISRRSGSNGRPRRSELELIDALTARYGLDDAMAVLRAP